MSPAADKQACLRFDRWLMPYVDSELDAVHVFEVEEHLESCGECSELVAALNATRSSLQVACKMVAPSSLRDRVGRTLLAEQLIDDNQLSSLEGVASSTGLDAKDEERAPSSQPEPGPSVHPAQHPAEPTLVRLRYMLPLAAAATFALLVGFWQTQRPTGTTAATTTASVTPPLAGLDNLVDDLVAQHANPPPPETTDPEDLGRFEPYVGVNVKRPRFKNPDIHWVGARMVRHGSSKTTSAAYRAMHQYRVRDKRRLTVYVFDSRKVPMRGSHLHERHVGTRKVYVGSVRGYSVAATERNNVGYVLASDMSPDESAQLMVAAK